METIDIAVIHGTARPGRLSDHLVPWLQQVAARRGDVRLHVVDPAVLPLDPLDVQVGGVLTAASPVLARADGFVVVTPEYNRSFPGTLKDLIDLHLREWRRKPVAFVAHGGRGGGLAAVEQLRPVFTEVGATTIRDAVLLEHGRQWVGADGFAPPTGTEAAAESMLDELVWWARALATARHGVRLIA